MKDTFFNEQKLQSEIKTNIVKKYFNSWRTVMIKTCKVSTLAYVDLFSGPGEYENELGETKPSTPLEILNICESNTELSSKVMLVFNDKETEKINKLEQLINSSPGIGNFKYKPIFFNQEVNEDLLIEINKLGNMPKLFFIDPYGYKGISLDLIGKLIKDFGSDGVIFFNYNRIQAALLNPVVDGHMKNLFGAQRHEYIKRTLPTLDKELKEPFILEMFTQALNTIDQIIPTPFQFISEDKNVTSHYLIHVTKHPLGHKIIKDIMYKESTYFEQNIASFSYIPVKHLNSRTEIQLSLLENYDGKLDILKSRLLENFEGRIISVKEIFEIDHIGTCYIEKNYKDALTELELDKKINISVPYANRRNYKGKKTLPDHLIVSF